MALNAVLLWTVVLLSSVGLPSAGYESIELFDIAKGQVVASVSSDAEIQREVEAYLRDITGVYVKLNPIPAKGFMAKIPLTPSVEIQSQLLKASVDEVVIIFPEDGRPYLMVFEENSPLFFHFRGSAEELLEKLKSRSG